MRVPTKEEANKGDYVEYSEYQQLAADHAALVQQGIRDHADWRSKLNFLEADYKSEIARLRDENERLRKAGEWQPIKTAPKDGTHILTCGDGYIVVAMWFVYHGGRSQWETVDGESEIDPTHWMPLPAAPAEGGRK